MERKFYRVLYAPTDRWVVFEMERNESRLVMPVLIGDDFEWWSQELRVTIVADGNGNIDIAAVSYKLTDNKGIIFVGEV